MDNKIKNISDLVKAFKSRNEKLHEEIKKNEEVIQEMQDELDVLLENEESESIKMV